MSTGPVLDKPILVGRVDVAVGIAVTLVKCGGAAFLQSAGPVLHLDVAIGRVNVHVAIEVTAELWHGPSAPNRMTAPVALLKLETSGEIVGRIVKQNVETIETDDNLSRVQRFATFVALGRDHENRPVDLNADIGRPRTHLAFGNTV